MCSVGAHDRNDKYRLAKMKMPDWLRDIVIAIGAFIGGRAINAVGESVKRGQDLQRSVDRLTMAVEHIGTDLRGIKAEIHDQVGGVKHELHEHKQEQELRMSGIEDRVDGVSQRVDALSTATGWHIDSPQERRRLQRLRIERGCFRPPDGTESQET